MIMQIEREYYENGQIRCERYYIDNKLHRENGPAVIHYNDNNEIKTEYYCIHGNNIHIEDYNDVNKLELIKLINEYNNINDLLTLKLITNIQFNNKKQYLLELIDSKITMLTLMRDS